MRRLNLTFAFLTASFVILMSLPFLVPHLGFLSLFGFVPLLLLDAVADAHGVKRFWIWYYLAFVLWNAATTFWICNATVGGAIFAILANAAQMAVIWALFRLSKKYFNEILSCCFLAVTWMTWEKLYMNAQISWPWLLLGNSFARSIRCIQWYEYTGVAGGSLWVWVSNIWLFIIIERILDGSWNLMNRKARGFALSGLAIILTAPFAVSGWIYSHYDEKSDRKMKVVIAQPNFDPYEKFVSMTQQQQNVILLSLFKRALENYQASKVPTLLLAPETFTSDILLNDVCKSATFNRFAHFLRDYPNANLLFGASTFEHIHSPQAPSRTARHIKDDLWYESHNSALITDSSSRYELFHKSKLVVGVESMPYPAIFSKLDDLLGGVIGRCVGQDSVTVLHCKSYDENGEMVQDVPVGSIICYESVYGEYCTGYVNAGAEALCVITNDAWWGDTPGYRQHLSYSCLRAIETRRDIARCANTGISSFINRKGQICDRTSWWKEDVLVGEISLNDERTFFVRNGDIVGRIACLMSFLLCLAMSVRIVTKKRENLN